MVNVKNVNIRYSILCTGLRADMTSMEKKTDKNAMK
jgi:hypothetical protein